MFRPPCIPRRHSRRDAKRARLRGVLEDWFAMGPPAPMPDLRPRPLLRRLAEPPRHEALPQDASSDHRRLQPARRLEVVLRQRDYARSQRSRHAAQRSDPALLLKPQRNRRIRGYARARDLARAHSEPRPLDRSRLEAAAPRSRPARPLGFATDSLAEENGFELLVPD
jgi:hypothetical protein